jgi:hypothetical protein
VLGFGGHYCCGLSPFLIPGVRRKQVVHFTNLTPPSHTARLIVTLVPVLVIGFVIVVEHG